MLYISTRRTASVIKWACRAVYKAPRRDWFTMLQLEFWLKTTTYILLLKSVVTKAQEYEVHLKLEI